MAPFRKVLRHPHDPRRLHELYEEFAQLWLRLHGLYLDAVEGFDHVRRHVEAEQRVLVIGPDLNSEAFQDTRSFHHNRLFNEAGASLCRSGVHRASQDERKARNAHDGANVTTLGQLCVISFYDFWNDYLRKEIVIAKGLLDPEESDDTKIKLCLRKHTSHDLWDDFRLLRISIAHRQGVGISELENAKCLKWFKPGEKIALTPDHMREIFLQTHAYGKELFEEHLPLSVFYVEKQESSHT